MFDRTATVYAEPHRYSHPFERECNANLWRTSYAQYSMNERSEKTGIERDLIKLHRLWLWLKKNRKKTCATSWDPRNVSATKILLAFVCLLIFALNGTICLLLHIRNYSTIFRILAYAVHVVLLRASLFILLLPVANFSLLDSGRSAIHLCARIISSIMVWYALWVYPNTQNIWDFCRWTHGELVSK